MLTDGRNKENNIKLAVTANILTTGVPSPWVDVEDYASFIAAIDAIGATERTLLIASEKAVVDDKTVPSNVTLKFLQGGSLNIANTKTVTINGHVEVGLYRIFKGVGSVVFGPGAVSRVCPEWFGTGNDHITVQAAVDSLGSHPGTVQLASKTYTFLSAVNITKSSVKIQGTGSTYIDVQTTAEFAFVSGDITKIADANNAAMFHTYKDIIFLSTAGTPAGMIAFYRVQCFLVESVHRVGGFYHASSTIGIRAVGSDCMGEIHHCFFTGSIGAALGTGISIEDGSNQVSIHHNSIGAITPIKLNNNLTTWIFNNTLQPFVETGGTGYSIFVDTQTIDALSWVPGHTQSNTWIYNNMFEPGAGTKTIYDIYLGYDTTANPTTGTWIYDNYFISQITTRTFVYVDNAQQTSIGNFTWMNNNVSTTKFVEITANADKTTINLGQIDAFQNTFTGVYTDYVTDNGTNTSFMYKDGNNRCIVGNLGIDTVPDISDGNGIHIKGKILRIETSKTPSAANDTGKVGEICWDADFIYVCVATDSWKRVAIAAW